MDKKQRALESYLKSLIQKGGYPGVAVCLRGPQGVLYAKGFGLRSMEPERPVDENTVFGIASMSKSMTTLACCILAVEGKLSLEDPISKYFPNLHLPGVPDESVTLRMIALHRAGIPPMEPLEWSIAMNSKERKTEAHQALIASAPNPMNTIDQIVAYLSEGPYGSLGAPGEYMSYSNEGYALLSYVVDMAAGVTLETFLMERIFKPLGMSRTVLDLDGSEARQLAGGNMTSLFERDEDGKLVWDDDWSVLPPFRGCACVKSTASDLAKYYQMLSNGGSFEGVQVIPSEAVELLIGKAYPLKDKPFYCMGLRKRLLAGKLMCDHGGALHGTSTMGGFIEGGYSVVVLCNEGEVEMQDLQWACYNYILGLPLEQRHDWAVPSGKTFSAPEMITGCYIAHEGVPTRCVVTYDDGELHCRLSDKPVLMRYCEKTIFSVYDPEKPDYPMETFRFYIRNGKAWGVKCGSRIYQREA